MYNIGITRYVSLTMFNKQYYMWEIELVKELTKLGFQSKVKIAYLHEIKG